MSLKLKVKPPSQANQPPPEAPPSATAPKRKLTIKFGSATQENALPTGLPSPAPPSAKAKAKAKAKAPRKPKTDKPARTSKPTPKKRDFDASTLVEDDDGPKTNGLENVKRLKLSIGGQSKPPPAEPKEENTKIRYIRTKFKGKIPDRPIGVGYDSGSSDVENDPALEEEFVLRMMPGEDCDYLRQAVEERKWGPLHEGGADIRLQFLMQDGRRAFLSIRKKLYAACLVDLPCVIEGMKSWDKKSWFKTADICQMLLVLGPIQKEAEAMDYPLPKDIDPQTWQYAHGLTPPMRFARERRFRKRVSNRTIEAVEEQVERLLALDAECTAAKGWVTTEIIDPDRLTQDQQDQDARDQAQDREDYGEEDAEGDEEDDAEGDEDEVEGDDDDIENNFEPINGEDDEPPEDDDEMEAALLEALENDEDVPEATTMPETMGTTDTPTQATPPIPTPDSAVTTNTFPPISPSTQSAPADTPIAITADTPGKTSVDSGDDASSSDEDEDAELDEAALEQQQERERQWAEVNDLKAAIKNQEKKAEAQPNAILRSKILGGVKSLRRDLSVKLAALGVEEGEDE
ncbi:MAG: hypothetical protein L6R40_006021 [Gallowayella cf. fulva]|nr:MAG: hypothetical protein L6R40_006021 [Xanthomendoza cf. fulva]